MGGRRVGQVGFQAAGVGEQNVDKAGDVGIPRGGEDSGEQVAEAADELLDGIGLAHRGAGKELLGVPGAVGLEPQGQIDLGAEYAADPVRDAGLGTRRGTGKGQLMFEDSLYQQGFGLFLAADMPIDRRSGQARLLGDLGDRGGGEAMLQKQRYAALSTSSMFASRMDTQ